MKGISGALIGVIVLLAIASTIIWVSTQFSTGSKHSIIYSFISDSDNVLYRLNLLKNSLEDSLTVSSYIASLDVAASGGTDYPVTYWFCHFLYQPPTIDEVNFGLANKTQYYLNSYIFDSKEKLYANISEYSCVAINDPGLENCLGRNSSKCEYFDSRTHFKNKIEIQTPISATKTDDIQSHMELDRFYWIYYNLYNDDETRQLMNRVQDGVFNLCNDGLIKSRVEQELARLCEHYKDVFDEYVKCSYDVLCVNKWDNFVCINTVCERNEKIKYCYGDADLYQSSYAALTGDGVGSLKFLINLTDTKYPILSREKKMQPLIWGIWGAIDFDLEETCRPPTTTTTIPPVTTIRPITTVIPTTGPTTIRLTTIRPVTTTPTTVRPTTIRTTVTTSIPPPPPPTS